MPGFAWDMAADLSRWEEQGRAGGQGQDPADGLDADAAGGGMRRPAPAVQGLAVKGRRRWRLPAGGTRRRVETAALAMVAVLGISACAAAVASRGSSAGTQVALAAGGPVVVLGDSVAAGSLVPQSPVGSPAGCLRSTHSYAADVARALHARTFIDAACSGASSADMTRSQSTTLGGTNRPQFSALARNDSIVMLTIGGNDSGGYIHVMETCVLLSVTGPSGDPCARRYGSSLAAATAADAPKIAAVLRGIRARAPHARVLVVGYPDVFPNTGGGCWPAVPIASGDVAFLRGVENGLNRMLATEAAATGVTYVNTYTPTIGHDFCKPERVRDVEGLLPGSLTEPFHPNARGHSVMAAQVLRALG